MSGFTVGSRSVRRKTVSCSSAGSVSSPGSSGGHHVVLSFIESHRVASVDPSSALRLSQLLSSSVGLKTRMSYMSGVRSLHGYCISRNLSSCPVDAITLAAWMGWVCPLHILPPSLIKYISGIRRHHLLAGLVWDLSSHPLVKMTLRSLEKENPSPPRKLKLPLTLSVLVKMCSYLPGWPSPSLMSFDDVLWISASALAFAAALRGGEFFTYPGSDRPTLEGRMVVPQVDGVLVNIPLPKAHHSLAFEHSFASCTSPPAIELLDPLIWLLEYRSRAFSLGFNVLGSSPAFVMSDRRPLSRSFMVDRSISMCSVAGITVVDILGNPVPVQASSWRCGYTVSAISAGVTELQIKSIGRWSSSGGMMAYSHASTPGFKRASNAIVAWAASNASGHSVVGQVSCNNIMSLL